MRRLSLFFVMVLLCGYAYGDVSYGWHDNAMWHDDGLVFDMFGDSIRVRKLFKPIYDMSFSMSHVSLTPTVDTKDFEWEWSHYSYEFIKTFPNTSIPNETLETYIFVGKNNDAIHNWTIELNFTPTKNVKIKHTLVVGSLLLTSPKFVYRFDYYDSPKIGYNDKRVDLSLGQAYTITPSLSALPTKLYSIGTSSFYFQDLVDTGNTISKVYIGDDYSTIEVSPPKLFYYKGDVIELDPESTGFLPPGTTGDPLDQWTNGNNTLVDDGNYASETTIGQHEDTSIYDFDIPSNARIDFAMVRLTTNAGSCPE